MRILLIVLILISVFNSCSEEPNFFELGKLNYSKKNYSAAKYQFSVVIGNDPMNREALIFLKKIDSIENIISYREEELKQIRINEEARKEHKTKNEKIIGHWECILPGDLECIITLKEYKGDYQGTFYFPFDKTSGQKKMNKIKDDRYYIEGSNSGEYFIVSDDGYMKYMDVEGLITLGIDILP